MYNIYIFGNIRYLKLFIAQYKDSTNEWDLNTAKNRSKAVALEGYKKIWNF